MSIIDELWTSLTAPAATPAQRAAEDAQAAKQGGYIGNTFVTAADLPALNLTPQLIATPGAIQPATGLTSSVQQMSTGLQWAIIGGGVGLLVLLILRD